MHFALDDCGQMYQKHSLIKNLDNHIIQDHPHQQFNSNLKVKIKD